jgi:Ca-activated chloride channel homolog
VVFITRLVVVIAGDVYPLSEKVMTKSISWLFYLLFWASVMPAGHAQSAHGALLKGDRQFGRENYKEAEKQYRIAADLDYSNPKALYNLGNALYQQGKWEDAAERFDLAAKNYKEPKGRAHALHNLGNAMLKQRKFQDAVDAYENSLRFNPGDAETKMNLQMARKMLQKEQAQQKQQQQQQQNQQQDQQQQNQQDQQGQKPSNQPNKPEQKPGGQQQQQPSQPSKQQKQEQQAARLKQAEAQRLLETAVGPEDQRNAKKYRSAQQQNKPKSSKKDW